MSTTAQRKKSWVRQYSKQGVCMHSSYGNIAIHALISIFWTSQKCTLRVEDVGHDIDGHTCSFVSFFGKNSHPIQKNTLFFLTFALSFNIFWLFCIAAWWQHSLFLTCSTMENKKCEEMASRGMKLSTHANTTTVSRGMHCKLQQMPEKAAKTPVGILIVINAWTYVNKPTKICTLHMSKHGFCILWT